MVVMRPTPLGSFLAIVYWLLSMITLRELCTIPFLLWILAIFSSSSISNSMSFLLISKYLLASSCLPILNRIKNVTKFTDTMWSQSLLLDSFSLGIQISTNYSSILDRILLGIKGVFQSSPIIL